MEAVAFLRSAMAACVLIATGACSGSEPVTTSATDLPPGDDRSVERVVDGDTLIVDGGERVRLIGIDTPETKAEDRPVECFGPEASAHLAFLLASGSDVRLAYDEESSDQYGRTLAYVYRRSDGLFVNAALVEGGYARAGSYRPNLAHMRSWSTWNGGHAKLGRDCGVRAAPE